MSHTPHAPAHAARGSRHTVVKPQTNGSCGVWADPGTPPPSPPPSCSVKNHTAHWHRRARAPASATRPDTTPPRPSRVSSARMAHMALFKFQAAFFTNAIVKLLAGMSALRHSVSPSGPATRTSSSTSRKPQLELVARSLASNLALPAPPSLPT
jgi:hypothetical protein